MFGSGALGLLAVLASAAPLETLCAEPVAAGKQEAAARDPRALLLEAEAAYDQDRFEESLVALRAAYAARPDADVLFNMAQACRAVGLREPAIALYERAARETEDVTLRDASVLRAQALRAERAATAVPVLATMPAPPEPAPEEPGLHRRWWFWVIVGAVAAAGAAAAVVAYASPRDPQYEDLRTVKF